MTAKFYKRNAVPTGGKLALQVKFKDIAGVPRDTDSMQTILIETHNAVEVYNSSVGVRRVAEGQYRFDFLIPQGFEDGVWSDTWTGTIDGYATIANFDFNVNSLNTIEATGDAVSTPEMKLGDKPVIKYTQEEMFGINILMEHLRYRLRNTQIKPDGRRCDILSVSDMQSFLWLALSEFNATPTFTNYFFSDPTIYTIFADILVEGAYLKALPSIIPAEKGREWVVTDSGVSVTPASVSDSLSSIMGTLYSEYRAKLKEAKRNHRPAPIGISAGSLVGQNTVFRKIRNLKLTGIF